MSKLGFPEVISFRPTVRKSGLTVKKQKNSNFNFHIAKFRAIGDTSDSQTVGLTDFNSSKTKNSNFYFHLLEIYLGCALVQNS